ncbi:MAG: hypothetical protein KDK97_01665, partial [Verrucomicrobiales bacterium]|nr:hypothetical protein [Verrucomicrobiales bacterium]
ATVLFLIAIPMRNRHMSTYAFVLDFNDAMGSAYDAAASAGRGMEIAAMAGGERGKAGEQLYCF